MNSSISVSNRSQHLRLRPILCVAGAVLIALWPHLSFSQELDEIVVTATKRDTNLQDTAIAITKYGAADLETARITNLAELGASTPGLFIGGDNSLGSSPVAIRGIGSINESIGADEGVGVYIDGVYQGKPFGEQFTFIDVDDIEVLRGPQGTLYGRNATGGAIAINTLTPGPQVVVKADASLTNLNGYQARALLSGPLVESTLYGKIAVGTDARDGYSTNPLTGQKLNNARNSMVSGALRWTPGGTWDITLRGYYGKDDARFAYKNALDGLPIDDIPATEPNESSKTFSGGTLNVSTMLGNDTFTSVTGYTNAYATYLSSSANVGLTQVAMAPIASHEWYQEIRLASPGNDAFTWIVGANFYHEKAYDRTNFALLFVPVGLNFHSDLTTDSYAAFAELAYRFTNGLRITAGGRYTLDKKNWLDCNASGEYTNLANLPPDACDGEYLTDRNKWHAVTPRVVLDYQLAHDVFGYLSATKGFRSGGWNFTQPVTGPHSGVDPENVWSYEAGLKSEAFEHRLRTNVAVFTANYSNLQVRSPDPATTLFGLRNAATAKIQGVEVEIAAQATKALKFGAAASVQNAKYVNYSYVSDGVLTDNDGHYLNNAPKWQASLDGEYEISLGGLGSLTPRVELRYVSDVYFTETNEFPYGAKAHETINGRLEYGAPSGRWGMRLFVDNATDQRQPTYAFAGITTAIVGVMIPPPTIYGVQAFYRMQ